MALLKKEIRSLFDSPTAYILLIVFLVVNNFFFWRSVTVANLATLRPMFDFLPWLFLFLLPAVTMKMLAEEKREGTIDLLLLQPQPFYKVVLSKFLAVIFFLIIALLFTLPLPLLLSQAGSFDWGQVFGQYLSALLLAMAMTAVGLFASALSKNQVVAYIIAVFILFIFILAGLEVVTVAAAGAARYLLEELSFLAHYQNLSRGVLSLSDLVYFAGLSLVFLGGSYWVVIKSTWGSKKRWWQKDQIIIVVFALLLILSVVGSGFIPGRFDLTSGRFYTLADGTRQILSGLDKPVTIKFFYSSTLPSQFSLMKKEVRDLLSDLQKLSSNVKVELVEIDSADAEQANAARRLGVVPVQFNILRKQEFSLQQGYFGLVVTAGDNSESIPFIDSLNNLEYQVTSLIYKLTVDNKPKVAFLVGHGEKGGAGELGSFKQLLLNQFSLDDIIWSDQSEGVDNNIPTDVKVVIIANPTSEIPSDQLQGLHEFIRSGGSVFILYDGVNVSPQLLQATVNNSNINDFLQSYGVQISQDLVFDLQANESVSFGGGIISYILPYPFWLRAQLSQAAPWQKVTTVTLPWASSLSFNSTSTEVEVKPLLLTSNLAGRQTSPFNISPQVSFPSDNLGQQVIAVTIKVKNNDQIGRLVVVGDSDFISESFVRQRGGNDNLTFALQAVEWLSQDQRLAMIRAKNKDPEPLIFKDKNQPLFIKWFNLVGTPLLVLLLAAGRWWYRRFYFKRYLG